MKDSQVFSIRRLKASFQYALEGLRYAVKHEKNIRIHLLAAFTTIILSILFQLTAFEWLFIVLAIFTVLVLELVNSAIERTVDLATTEIKPLAKQAKDIAAAAVLLAATMAVIVGVIIFGPKFIDLFLK
ncbi:diacylglycerol kinase family protein [Bacillus sp. FJAT-50079]|uniref:diacylglycerol kinase n=1 Tax=Bacillus sp. FJAT-50079 TaxID=2833577 RepID=UPI0020166B16|nr:diacylglycerol kinase family protein [Bacillus sp. FJAT-50079]